MTIEFETTTLDAQALAYKGDSQYDFDNEILMNWYPRRILDRVGQAGSLLELGLGHGFTTQIFAQHFDRHLVLEGSQEVIGTFQAKSPDCSAKITQTWFERFETSERFDTIVMGFVLEHVDDPVAILRQYRDFLAPGGKMFLAVPNAEVLNRRLGHAAGALDDITYLSEHDHLLGHQRYYTVDTFTAHINAAGYKVDRMEGIYLKPFMTQQMIALNLEPAYIDALCQIGVHYPELSCGLLAEVSGQ
ncbi:class I SAM-dependent methyltransferase [Roseovarius sp. LXJ103]|uniref:class I SAM-dependent methyltransferase n=1 Tax=Roseovarius carneus TaxID=2853164 RepID=UPI000D61544E|nr:class I SAM-dependent methyltransferase [Roseovarius carneus]MBZ8119936.1 class I SAM-dependent methyltransferase [Roseovarius carneus]PWE34473.1 SAM-dependent methyltransferase [Pelagicola sp. LXJ1103]